MKKQEVRDLIATNPDFMMMGEDVRSTGCVNDLFVIFKKGKYNPRRGGIFHEDKRQTLTHAGYITFREEKFNKVERVDVFNLQDPLAKLFADKDVIIRKIPCACDLDE